MSAADPWRQASSSSGERAPGSEAHQGWALAALTAFLTFLALGGFTALHAGLTWDERTEQGTFGVIAGAVREFLFGNPQAISRLQNYQDRYYGIGFHAVAYPLQMLLSKILPGEASYSLEGSVLLAKHPLVFLSFGACVFLFFKFTKIFFENRWASFLFAAAFATYPYLLGHALFNVKDTPYMAAYFLCTYLSVRIVAKRLGAQSPPGIWDFSGLVLATAFLAAIRIPGLVIVAQYLITFLAAEAAAWRSGRGVGRILNLRTIPAFPALLVALVVIAYPALWMRPFSGLPEALGFMLKHPGDTCTLTWGQCLWAQNLPATYLPAWLLVKLPVFVLLGLALVPVAAPRIIKDPVRGIALLTLAVGIGYPLATAVVFRAVLYDETRQVLFIYPMLFLASCVSLYFLSKLLAMLGSGISLILFLVDDFTLTPFQYIYLNEAARFSDVNQRFETDYWGASARELSLDVTRIVGTSEVVDCVFAEPAHLYRPFIPADVCVRDLADLDRAAAPFARPYLVATYSRRMRFSEWRPDRPECAQAAEVSRRFALSGRKVKLAGAYVCRPALGPGAAAH